MNATTPQVYASTFSISIGLSESDYDIVRSDISKTIEINAANEGKYFTNEVQHNFLEQIGFDEDGNCYRYFQVTSWAYCLPIIGEWNKALEETNQ